MFLGAVCGRLRRRGARLAGAARGRPAHGRDHGLGRRQHGRQGAALRDRRLGAFDVVTTVTSCGAVNSALESFTGIGGAVPLRNLSASEVIFGGVGTGLYSILLYVLLAVFIGGLMVGRTPERLGKKLEAREIKLAGLGILVTPLAASSAPRWRPRASAGRKSISEVGAVEGRRQYAAGVLGDVLRVPVAGQQQRLGVRRLHGLHTTQRRQSRGARRHVRRSARRL